MIRTTPRRPLLHTTALGSLFACTVAGSLLLASVAHAQYQTPTLDGAPPPAAPTPAPAAATPAVAPQAFVLMAMTGDPEVDEHLRATADQLNQRLRAKGYAEVDPARVGQAISADPSAIGTLRARLDAACMVRVDVKSRIPGRVWLSITVQSQAEERTAAAEGAPAEIPANVVAATDPLIPAAQAAPPPAPAAAVLPDQLLLVDGTTVNCEVLSVAGGYVVVRMPDNSQQSLEWGRVQQIIRNGAPGQGPAWAWAKQDKAAPKAAEPAATGDWSKRGGSLLTFGVQGEILGVLAHLDHPYVINYPDGQTMKFTGDSASGGGGGGVGLHIGFLQLEIPDPAESSTLFGFRVGTGIDLGAVAFGYRTDSINIVGQSQGGAVVEPPQQEGGTTEWSSASVFLLPLTLGGQIGFGHFAGNTWRGVMVGVDWRPTYTYTNPSDVPGIGSFNYAGIQLNIDTTSLEADAEGPEANFRVSLFYLPKIDRNASYAGIGFGAGWY